MWKLRVKEISFILIGAIFFWLVDTIIDELLFEKRSFADALFFNIPHRDIYIRLTTVVAIIVFGLVIARYANKLNASEGRYRQLFDNVNDAIFIHPIASAEIPPNFMEVNAKATGLLGYNRNELLQLSLADLVPPEISQELDAMLKKLMVDQHTLSETVLVAKDGRQIPVEINAHLVDLLGRPTILSIARDISLRRQTQEALTHKEMRLQAIFGGAAIGMVLVDLEGRILEVNPAAQKISGYDQDELLGHHFRVMSFPDDLEPGLTLFTELAAGKRDLYQLEKRFLCKNGKLLWGSLTVSLMRDAAGGPRYAIGMIEDITARKEAEAALHQAHADLEDRVEARTRELGQVILKLRREVEERRAAQEAQRQSEEQLHALTRKFLTTQEMECRRISRELHDELGQALMLLKFKLNALADKLPESFPDLRKQYDSLLNNLDDIIENLRRLSRDLSPTILEELGLSSALRFLLEEVSKYSEINHFTIETAEIDDLFPHNTQINIYRIFQESLTNIVRHSQARQVSVAIQKHDDYVSFSIADDGRGFEVQQVLAREPSQRGLGLAAMQERVRIAGGNLDIWSQIGSGTRITFTIPTRPGSSDRDETV
jgi:PAS domain S-box-containing protein